VEDKSGLCIDKAVTLSFSDRVVQHSFCDNLLEPFFEKRLIYDCAACRKGKGTHFAIDRLNGFLRAFYRKHGTDGWILKCDVRKYFDSIDHDVLKRMLAKYPDPDVRLFLDMVIDSYHKDTGKVIRRLRTSNKRRFKQRLKKFQKLYSQGDITADKIKMSLASYNGHLKHGHTWKLKKKVYGDFVLKRDSSSNEEKP